MRSARDEIRRVAGRLHDDLHVDIGLDEAIGGEDTGSPVSLAAAQAAVLARVRAVQAASGELRQLLSTLTDLGGLARFTAEGWPERRDELAAAFAADAMGGLFEWAEECCLAAAELRVEALERLVSEQFSYPPGAATLQARFSMVQRVLAKRDWQRARPVLRAAAEGLRIGDRDAPAPEVRAALRILLARVAVHLGEDPSADIEAAERLGAPTADTALVRAWAARIADRPGDAAACLADARAGGSSIAVIAELTRQAPEADPDAALSACQDRLASVASIIDIASQLDRLIEPAPAEVWLAAAERALRESDRGLAVTALDRAEREVGDRPALGAIAYERRARLLAADGDQASVVQAWLSAADCRWTAGQPDIAQRHYRTAATLQPDSAPAALGLLCAEAAECTAKPGPDSDARLIDVLAKLESLQADRGVQPDTSWSLQHVAFIHAQLAQVGEDSANHVLGAFLALGRALILTPKAAGAWGQLADLLGTFGLSQMAVLAASRAYALDPGQREELIRATLNVGDLTAGRDLLSTDVDHSKPWIKATDAFIQLREGNLETAIGLLRDATTADPSLAWARDHLMWAYLLSGETESARREARQLSAYIGDRRAPEDLWRLADCALLTGDLAEAERLGVRLAEWERHNTGTNGREIMGRTKLLSGRAEGTEDLVQLVRMTRTTRQLDDWERYDVPLLRALAKERGIELPDLGPVTEAVARRRAELGTEADPLAELTDVAAGAAFPAADQVRAVLAVLLCEAGADAAGAVAALEAGASAAAGVPEWPWLADRVRRDRVADWLSRGDLDQALAAEQARLTDPEHAQSASRLAEIAGLLSMAGRHDDAAHALAAARADAADTPELTRIEGDLSWRRGRRAEAVKAWERARAEGADRTDVRLGICAAGTDLPGAVRLLSDAIARSYIDTATDLHALLAEPADIAAVTQALREVATHPDALLGSVVAVQVIEALPGELRLPEQGLEVHLPQSWFAGAADPVNDVPLLGRYIPEARLRLAWTMPGVQARDDLTLEPAGFRVLVLGQVAEDGQLPAAADFVFADAVPLLSPAARARVTGQRVSDAINFVFIDAVPLLSPAGRARVTEERIGDIVAVQCLDEGVITGMDALLLIPAGELVALVIQGVADAFSAVLQQFWAATSKG